MLHSRYDRGLSANLYQATLLLCTFCVLLLNLAWKQVPALKGNLLYIRLFCSTFLPKNFLLSSPIIKFRITGDTFLSFESTPRIAKGSILPFNQALFNNLPAMVKYRAKDGYIILTGFNYSYRNMLANLVCRFHQLGIENYVIVAFDGQALLFCYERSLPCFPTSWDIMTTDLHGNATSLVQAWNTEGFRTITRMKSRKALDILELGYDVVWTDIDVFWKAIPIPRMLEALSDGAHIAISSDAVPTAEPNAWLNSGLYYVKHSDATIKAFQEIVQDAAVSQTSEQPAFNKILCAQTQGPDICLTTDNSVTTRILDRTIFPHGAMYDVVIKVTLSSEDDVATVHYNYRSGREEKEKCLFYAGMWLVRDEDATCKQVDGEA